MAISKLADSELCEIDGKIQTIELLNEECVVHSFPGGMEMLHLLEEDAVRWLSELKKD